jgi:hypothetical protein
VRLVRDDRSPRIARGFSLTRSTSHLSFPKSYKRAVSAYPSDPSSTTPRPRIFAACPLAGAMIPQLTLVPVSATRTEHQQARMGTRAGPIRVVSALGGMIICAKSLAFGRDGDDLTNSRL